jgi:GH24 family phage-related lysozyme (muramidase)
VGVIPKIEATDKKKVAITDDWIISKVIEHEGFRVDPYVDTEGYLTGGIGHKFTKEDIKNFDENWSREEKMKYWEERFYEDLSRAQSQAGKLIQSYGIEDTPVKRYVLTDMIFNLGATGVSKFENFLTDLSEGNIEGAIKEMKQKSKDNPSPSKWYKQVPNRVDSLADILRSHDEYIQ